MKRLNSLPVVISSANLHRKPKTHMFCEAKKKPEKLKYTPAIVKVLENKFDQVVKISFEIVLCLSGFMKAKKSRESSEVLDCVQNVCTSSCLPCQSIKAREMSAKREGLLVAVFPVSLILHYLHNPQSTCYINRGIETW